jgi:hypothetical protein
MAHTRGSPRFQASRVRSSVSPSMLSVFARRRRLGTAIEPASTTWVRGDNQGGFWRRS